MHISSIRSVGHWFLVVVAMWLLVAGLLAWVTSGDQTLGIVQAIPLGVPAWHLIVPVYGALSLVLLLKRPPGTYWFLTLGNFVFAFAVSLPLLGSWDWLRGDFDLQPTLWAALIFLLALISALVAVVMMPGEVVPLDSPVARLVYLGRFKHLQELYRLAAQRDWQATGPQSPDHSVMVTGVWHGRDVTILSRQRFHLTSEGDAFVFYGTTVAAQSVLPVMFVANERAKPKAVPGALRGQCQTSGKQVVDFYVLPAASLTVEPDTIERLTQALDHGRRFLRAGSTLSTRHNAIIYSHKSSVRMTDDAVWIACLVDWLVDVASTLEKATIYAPLSVAERKASPTATDSAAGLAPAPRKSGSPVSSPSSLAGRALLAVLLTVGFYGLALVMVGALLFVVYADIRWANVPSGRLILSFVALAAVILWSILPRRDRFEAPGPQLLAADHPRLLHEVEDIARHMKQAMPREVYLTFAVNAGVMERGGMMGIGSRRVMLLGLPLLQVLTVSQLRGVIAHEFGHFYSGDTKLAPWVYRTRGAIGRTIENLGAGSLLQAPFRWYGLLFLRITREISRHQEFVADALAARLVGPQTCADGLRISHGHAAAFESYMQQDYLPALQLGYNPPLLEGFDRFTHAAKIVGIIDQVVAEQIQDQVTSPYDTHPGLGERLAALAALPASPPELDTTPAVSLLGDITTAEAALLAIIIRPEYRNRLQSVSWDGVGTTVYLPGWRDVVKEHAATLAGVTAATLPDFQAAPVALVAVLRQRAERTLLDQEIAAAIPAITGAALAVALADQGWVIDATPGSPITLRHDDTTVEPFTVTHQLADGSLAGDAWVQRCRELNIGDLDLAAAASAPQAG